MPTSSYPHFHNPLSVSTGLPILTFHRNGTIRHMSFCVWLLSLTMMSSRSTPITAFIGTSFLLTAEYYVKAWMLYVFFHSLTDDICVAFTFLAIMDDAAMKICVEFCVCVKECFHFLEYVHHTNWYMEITHCFPQWLCHLLTSSSAPCEGCDFCTCSLIHLIVHF